MKQIAIVFHSANGHTRELANNVFRGVALVPSVKPLLLELTMENSRVFEKLLQSDGIIFGSPTYMGTVSGIFKNFMDQSGDFWLEQPWKNKVAAGFTIATSPSGDKFGTLSALMVFAMQHGMLWVGQDHIGSIHTKDGLNLNEDGSWVGLMARSNPDKTLRIFKGDKETAIRFGQRVANIVKSFQKFEAKV